MRVQNDVANLFWSLENRDLAWFGLVSSDSHLQVLATVYYGKMVNAVSCIPQYTVQA